MIDASIAVARDPAHPAMRQLIEDATNPARVAALRAAFTHLRAHGEKPHDHHVRAAITGETLAGTVFRTCEQSAALVTPGRIVAVPRADLPASLPSEDALITVKVRAGFGAPAATPSKAESYWAGLAAKTAPNPAAPKLAETPTRRLGLRSTR